MTSPEVYKVLLRNFPALQGDAKFNPYHDLEYEALTKQYEKDIQIIKKMSGIQLMSVSPND